MKKAGLSLFLLLLASYLGAQTLILEISHIRNAKGSIQLMFYKSAGSYEEDLPFQVNRFPKDSVLDGCLKLSFQLPVGEYGIILLDDENESEVAEYNILGLPKEGFGFAGYYHRGIRRPEYKDFRFQLENETKKMQLKIRYI